MIFDVYKTITTRDGRKVPGTKPSPMEWSAIEEQILKSKEVGDLVERYRKGDKDAKPNLPAINFVGRTVGVRRNDQMEPTQLVMVDIDHCADPCGAWENIHKTIIEAFGDDWFIKNVILVHITPSGKGLHLFFVQQNTAIGNEQATLLTNMLYLNDALHFDHYGDFDTKVQDFSRLSFAFPFTDMLFRNAQLFMECPPDWSENGLCNPSFRGKEPQAEKGEVNGRTEDGLFSRVSPFTDKEKAEFESLDYRGTLVSVIIEKYVEVQGKPSSGEVHNYYNELVKNFRSITSNNRRALLYLLPRFGHSYDECWDQIVSICRVNTLSRLERNFYFFLKDNGFYQRRDTMKELTAEPPIKETNRKEVMPPFMPPVFRELVGTAPADFVLPCINALLPILGTLSSYVGAVYPYDARVHTTSFFSVIYAPPGTGKGFVERFLDLLFEDLKLRDLVQSCRENIFLRALNKKSDNEKAPDRPRTSLRIIPAKNSEAEFLEKQRDNCGYHMFTYAAEMDSWAKGVRAAGGNKDDMIRIAWDNGEYGQQFKSASTFKGMVNLYWNVLITGTYQQLENYFKNVENGLVTRCSFTSIDNQEYAEAPRWRALSSKALDVIRRYMQRCDSHTYTKPCDLSSEIVLNTPDEDYDKEIPWRFEFREREIVDCSWIMPTIDKFHEEQRNLAAQNVDQARDVFRRRVGVRGFRLALLCMTLWEKPRKQDLQKCCDFIWWYMHKDIECMLKLWGEKYNELSNSDIKITQRSVFGELSETFSINDVYVLAQKQGVKTSPRRIVFDWKKLRLIDEVGKGEYKKVKR